MTSDDVLRIGRPDLSPGIYRGLLKEVADGDGTGLFGAHAAGATTLTVAAGAFRSAGQCRIDGVTYDYVRDGDLLDIDPPLAAAAEDGEPVESLTPAGKPEESRKAKVDLDMDGNPEGDVWAVISGDLAGYYPLGDAAAGSLVTVRDTPYGYEVAGRPTDAPLFDGAAIEPGTIPDANDAMAAALAALDAANEAADFAEVKNRVFWQATPPVSDASYTLVMDDTWFDTDDGNRINRWTGSSWVTATGSHLTTPNGRLLVTPAGLFGYNASSALTFALDAGTGAITMVGPLVTGGDVQGATVTGGVVQTTGAVARGIKMNSGFLIAYDASGNPTFSIDAATGSVAMKGDLLSGSTITGATVQTTTTANRGIRMDATGFKSYSDGSSGDLGAGSAYFTLDAASGQASSYGQLLEGFPRLIGATLKNDTTVEAGNLHVTGGYINASGSITSNGAVHGNNVFQDGSAGGGLTGASLNNNGQIVRDAPSTRRVKENIEAHEIDGDAFLALGIYAHTYIDDVPDVDHDRTYISLMAEDLADAGFEPWVTRDGAGELNGIAYERLTVPLLAVAQRQAARLDEKDQQITDLIAQLADLTDRVAALEETSHE